MTRKRRRNGSRICDDEVLLNIFSHLPTRDAVRCTALSRHHQRLIGGSDFWILHRRLGPPTPRPHIAYMASSVLPGGLFHDFHLAGYGGKNDGLRRALIDREPPHSRRHKYVGTCNGVVLLAGESFYAYTTVGVVLLNPAVAGSEQEVHIELPRTRSFAPAGCCYRISGFGYGPSSRCHKLLLTVERRKYKNNLLTTYDAGLLAYTLGLAGNNPERCRAVLSTRPGTKISDSSVYLDGKVYLLADQSRVLAFNVDEDTVAAIDLPGERAADELGHGKSELMEMSGRLCVATASGEGSIALWLLTEDQKWKRRCLLPRNGADKLAGLWDCGGVLLLLFFQGVAKEPDLILYDTRINKAFEPLHVQRRAVAEPEEREPRHVFCWGYRPTLVTPRSIVGGARPLEGGVVAALNPVLERDVSTGRKRTRETVCFIEMLLQIMRQLPDKANDIVREFSRGSLPFSPR